MPLTKEQFEKLSNEGFSPEEIASFEKRRVNDGKSNDKGLFGNVGEALNAYGDYAIDSTRGALQTVSGGAYGALENFIAEKRGVPPPKNDSLGYAVGRGAGYIPLGMGVSAVGNIASRAIPALASRSVGPILARGAAEGALTGAIGTPEARKEAAIGGGIGGAVFSLFPKVINLGGKKVAQNIAEKADKGFDEVGGYLENQYDDFFDSLKNSPTAKSAKVKVDSIVQDIDETVSQFPEATGTARLKAIRNRLIPTRSGKGIPELKSTNDAFVYGDSIKTDKNAISELEKKVSKLSDYAKKLGDSGDDAGALEAANMKGIYQEALDASKGNLSGAKKQIAEKVIASSKEISAKDLHNIKQEIRKNIPKNVWNGYADPDAMQSSQMDLYFKINDRLADISPKYKGLGQEYRKYKEAERLLRRVFYEQGVPSNKNIGNELSVPQERALEYFRKQLPPEKDFVSDFEAFRRGRSIKKAIPYVAGAAGAGTLGAYGASQISK